MNNNHPKYEYESINLLNDGLDGFINRMNQRIKEVESWGEEKPGESLRKMMLREQVRTYLGLKIKYPDKDDLSPDLLKGNL